ncbi:hypothetical protein BJ170DRAFT_677585 [Xylariales sp. AK1849]|nr:hypothetical protein BJ170DRAFT_677585 [Xylariales sp. AK1849]
METSRSPPEQSHDTMSLAPALGNNTNTSDAQPNVAGQPSMGETTQSSIGHEQRRKITRNHEQRKMRRNRASQWLAEDTDVIAQFDGEHLYRVHSHLLSETSKPIAETLKQIPADDPNKAIDFGFVGDKTVADTFVKFLYFGATALGPPDTNQWPRGNIPHLTTLARLYVVAYFLESPIVMSTAMRQLGQANKALETFLQQLCQSQQLRPLWWSSRWKIQQEVVKAAQFMYEVLPSPKPSEPREYLDARRAIDRLLSTMEEKCCENCPDLPKFVSMWRQEERPDWVTRLEEGRDGLRSQRAGKNRRREAARKGKKTEAANATISSREGSMTDCGNFDRGGYETQVLSAHSSLSPMSSVWSNTSDESNRPIVQVGQTIDASPSSEALPGTDVEERYPRWSRYDVEAIFPRYHSASPPPISSSGLRRTMSSESLDDHLPEYRRPQREWMDLG